MLNIDTWRPFRDRLAVFVTEVVENHQCQHEVVQFVASEQVRAEYQRTLERLGDRIAPLAGLVHATATKEREAFVSFAARFDPPWHAMAHVVFLVPLVYERLCTLMHLRNMGAPSDVWRFALHRDLLAVIEARQRDRAVAAGAKK